MMVSTRSQPLAANPNHLQPINTLEDIFISLKPTVILPFHLNLGLPNCLFPLGFAINCMCISHILLSRPPRMNEINTNSIFDISLSVASNVWFLSLLHPEYN